MNAYRALEQAPVPDWFERAGRLTIGLYFALPCVGLIAAAAVRGIRGDAGSPTALALGLALAVAAVQAWRGRFLIPAIYIGVAFILNVLEILTGKGPTSPDTVAGSAMLMVSMAWILVRRYESRDPSKRIRGSVCALLAVVFVAWTVTFAIRLGNAVAILAVPQPVQAAVVSGQRAPVVQFVDGSGDVEDLQRNGVVYVVNFWATWCGPCRKELPVLQALMGEFESDERLRFLAVNTEELDRGAVDAFIRDEGLEHLPTYVDPSSTHDAFGVTILPSTLVVKDRLVVARFDGYSNRTIPDLRSAIERQIGSSGGVADEVVPTD